LFQIVQGVNNLLDTVADVFFFDDVNVEGVNDGNVEILRSVALRKGKFVLDEVVFEGAVDETVTVVDHGTVIEAAGVVEVAAEALIFRWIIRFKLEDFVHVIEDDCDGEEDDDKDEGAGQERHVEVHHRSRISQIFERQQLVGFVDQGVVAEGVVVKVDGLHCFFFREMAL